MQIPSGGKVLLSPLHETVVDVETNVVPPISKTIFVLSGY